MSKKARCQSRSRSKKRSRHRDDSRRSDRHSRERSQRRRRSSASSSGSSSSDLRKMTFKTGGKDMEIFSKYLFYTRIISKSDDGTIVESDEMKSACSPFYTMTLPGRNFAISTQHGPHACLTIGDEISLYNHVHEAFKAKVIFVHDKQDFIVFESNTKLCERIPNVGPAVGGRPYLMLGFADLNQKLKQGEHLEPCYLNGIIRSSQTNETGHVAGNSGAVSDFSGGPVFDLVNSQLVGICVSTDDPSDLDTSFSRFASDMINHCKETTIVRILPVQSAASALTYLGI